MAWIVEILPDECSSVSIILNNISWHTWLITDGPFKHLLPPPLQETSPLKFGAVVSPEGKNGKVNIYWNGVLVQRFDFDNYEDHDCVAPFPDFDPSKPVGPWHPPGHGVVQPLEEPIHLPVEVGATQHRIPENTPRRTEILMSNAASNISARPPRSVKGSIARDLILRMDEKQKKSTGDPLLVFSEWRDQPWILRSHDGWAIAVISDLSITIRGIDRKGKSSSRPMAAVAWRITNIDSKLVSRSFSFRIMLFSADERLLEQWDVDDTSVALSEPSSLRTAERHVRSSNYRHAYKSLVIAESKLWISSSSSKTETVGQRFKFDLPPTDPDLLDSGHIKKIRLKSNFQLTDRFSLKDRMTPAKDQSRLGVCATFCAVSCLEFFTQNNLSEACLTDETERFYGDCVAGVSLGEAMMGAKENGVVEEQYWAFDDRQICWSNPPPPEVAQRQRFRFDYVWLVFKLGSGDAVESIKATLTQYKVPVCVSIPVYGNNDWLSGPDITNSDSSSGLAGLHALPICGFDDNLSRFEFKNSWGATWGSGGFGTITYEYISKYCTEAFAATM